MTWPRGFISAVVDRPGAIRPQVGVMRRHFRAKDRTAFVRLLAAAALALLGTASAQAQYATACPPPKKLAAGACVAACPAGYEDRGLVCVYRNTSR